MQKIKNAMHSAKASLKNKWHFVILVFCIVAAALGVKMLFISLVTLVFSNGVSSLDSTLLPTLIILVATALELFGFCPLYIGALRWLWQTVVGADEPLDTLFYYYETKKDYLKAIDVSFNFLWRAYGYFLICGIPFAVVTWARQMLVGSAYFNQTVINIAFWFWVAIGIAGVVLFTTLLARHFLVLPVMFSDDNIDPYDAFRVSNIISKGRISSVLLLVLRFLPMFLICVVALPIIWVVPYFVASLLVFAKFSIVDYKASLISSQNPPQNEQ